MRAVVNTMFSSIQIGRAESLFRATARVNQCSPLDRQAGGLELRRRRLAYYIAIVDGADETWGVRFPDFPGCHGGGATPSDAVADATSALREFAADMLTDGEAIPPPRALPEIAAAGEGPDAAVGEAFVMIPLLLDRGRPLRANLSLDAGMLEQIDAEAKRRGLTRSAFLVSAAIDKIETAS